MFPDQPTPDIIRSTLIPKWALTIASRTRFKLVLTPRKGDYVARELASYLNDSHTNTMI